jgi:hypothetical protein
MSKRVKKYRLVIYSGEGDCNLSAKYYKSYIYVVGSGKVKGEDLTILNDGHQLNKIAEELRDDYSDWVHSKNTNFLEKNLVLKKLSLFFLTDFSCKRSEIFDTFNTICNLTLIVRKIEEPIKEVVLIGVDSSFVQSAQSVFSEARFILENIKQYRKFSYSKSLVRNFYYFLTIFLIGLTNHFSPISIKSRTSKTSKRLFLTRYPLHFSDCISNEEKYGEMVTTEDRFAVSIVTDGFHQKTSITKYLKYRKQIQEDKFTIIDDYVKPYDSLSGFLRSIKLLKKWISLTSDTYRFKEIDLSSYCSEELIFSFERVVRLIMWDGIIRRFLKQNKTSVFIYYLHEYAYGRLFSYILSDYSEIKTIGMQHGPASFRKMLYSLSQNESGDSRDFLRSVPIPENVLAEDDHSKRIYEYSGYRNVKVMPQVYRLQYLNNITLKDQKHVLIATGLHDGKILLDQLEKEILANPDIKYVIKPHPRASKSYLDRYAMVNLHVTNSHIVDLLINAKKVYVTYSSVGLEAAMLGIDVSVIDIPGIISESPLLDEDYLIPII